MIYNLNSSELFTNDGDFIKKIHCPYKNKDYHINPVNKEEYSCNKCSNSILITKGKTDKEIKNWVNKKGSHACLAIAWDDPNLQIIED